MVEVSHITGQAIARAKSVLLSPEPDGRFSILYVEV